MSFSVCNIENVVYKQINYEFILRYVLSKPTPKLFGLNGNEKRVCTVLSYSYV